MGRWPYLSNKVAVIAIGIFSMRGSFSGGITVLSLHFCDDGAACEGNEGNGDWMTVYEMPGSCVCRVALCRCCRRADPGCAAAGMSTSACITPE